MKTIKYSKLLLKTAILTSIGYSCFAQTSGTTFINFNKTYQVIDGFGASCGAGGFSIPLTEAQVDMFFSPSKGIGLSLLRSGISPDGTTVYLSIMRQVQTRGATVWSNSYTPPGEWKSNDTITNGGYLLPQYYPDYAGWFANYVSTMKDSGINIYGVSIQNEPEVTQSYVSCTWTSAQMHAFIPYLYDSLQSRGLGTTKIMAAEDDCWELTTVAGIMNDPVTDSMLGICVSHDYCGTTVPFNTNGKPLWETEVSTVDAFDSSIANGLYWANNINQFMTVANANAWHYWELKCYTPDNEGLTDTAGNPAKRMYALGNFSKFVRPGYLRVDDTLGPSGVALSAYEDTANGAFAIVAINNNDTATTIVFNLPGLSAASVSSVTPWITSGTLDLIEQQNIAVSNSSFSYTLPDSSVTTFVYTGTTTGINNVNIANNNISVYPNPAQNELTVGGLDASEKNQTVRIYSSLGALVYKNTISGTEHYTLNLTGFASGIYCVIISNISGETVKKIMIAK